MENANQQGPASSDAAGLPPIPPALMSRPRRVVRSSWSAVAGIWVLRLFLLPHTLVGMGALGAAIGFPIWANFGHDHHAKVTQTRYYTSTTKGNTRDHYEVTYSYQVEGRTRKGSADVEESTFRALGGTVTEQLESPKYGTVIVRSLGSAPPLYYDAVIETGQPLWQKGLGITFFALFWNGIMSIFLYAAYYVPWRTRRLYRNGQVGFGVITNKYTKSGKSTSYYIEYDFFTATGQPGHGKTQVNDRKSFDAAYIRQNVIVLHADGRVKPSVVYDFGGYKCV